MSYRPQFVHIFKGNFLTYLGSADLQSAAKEYAFPFIGGLQIPRCYRSNLFLTADCKSAGTT